MTDIEGGELEAIENEPRITTVFMSQETMNGLLENDGHDWVAEGWALGIRILIDNNLPFKALRMGYEEFSVLE